MSRVLRLAIIASARFPIREPFAGGLEAHTWSLAQELRRRGHRVTVFAGPGSDPALDVRELGSVPVISDQARSDVSMSSESWLNEHHAYLELMLSLAGSQEFDLVHNNSLHYLPVAMASSVPQPVVTTLHTPPTPWLESAIAAPARCPVTFVAVSEHTARAWRHRVPESTVVHNGIDLRAWPLGPGDGPLVWTGRMVPEKGPALAVRAARLAGVPLRLAGPIGDRTYFDDEVRPLLGGEIQYVGHLGQRQLAELVGRARASLVTPCWEEPYGLVVAESLACGTPVCGFDRGALAELVTERCARLVPADDVEALAAAIGEVRMLSRLDARAHAERTCSLSTMVDRYEHLFRELIS
ncbi:glycosyltransferase family 4 protein [Pseudonocardiaceae bacterium YIM PH 21723]|nr:glycosyltransferase family 4 protein [Pseudonocardiaceae bacterium YIM PH 21723]